MNQDVEKESDLITIVVIEDDRYVLDFLKFTLEQQGNRVYAASDGEEGLSLINKHKPNLVILDLMLPKVDGFTILKKLQEEKETKNLRVVVLSAYTVSETTRAMVMNQKNVIEIFTKPVRNHEFISRINKILKTN